MHKVKEGEVSYGVTGVVREGDTRAGTCAVRGRWLCEVQSKVISSMKNSMCKGPETGLSFAC